MLLQDRRFLLLSLMYPLVRTLRAVVSSNLAKTVNEGSTLQDRLRSVITKVHLPC
jgi:hypothetical protein